MTDESDLSVMVELAASNAKRVQREARAVVRDLARIRDYLADNNLDTVQSNKEDTTT